MFAMLAAIFTPSLSAAFASTPEIPISWEEICSQVHTPDQSHFSKQSSSSDHDGHANHCPLCIKQSHAIDLLPVVTVRFVDAENPFTFIAAPDVLPSSRISWTLLPSRAPPVIA